MPFPDAPSIELVGQLAIWLSVAMAFASVPSVLRSRRGSPLAALSWLFALMLFPGAGALLWWFIGRNALRRRRTKRAAKRVEYLERRGQPSQIQVPYAQIKQENLVVSASVEVHSNITTPVRILCEGPEAFSRIGKAISSATTQISVLYYIWADDPTGRDLRKRLVERAKAGVQVRVLLDAIGSYELGRHYWKELTQAGGRVEVFMPPRIWTKRRPSWNFRNHRKILVVDHHIAFSGGMNVSDHYANAWKDVHMQIHGIAAQALEQIFCEDWYYTTGEFISLPEPHELPEPQDPEKLFCHAEVTVLSSGPDSPQPWIHDHYFRAMASAKTRIWIATPYFVPTESISTALRTAALRGVDVRVLVPGKSDQRLVQWAARAYYPTLVAAGVKIYEYQPSMMHAKVWVIDEDHSAIGSANLDPRSFRLNFEVSTLLKSTAVVSTLETWFDTMLKQATLIQESTLSKTPRWQVLRDSVAHLWSPLL